MSGGWGGVKRALTRRLTLLSAGIAISQLFNRVPLFPSIHPTPLRPGSPSVPLPPSLLPSHVRPVLSCLSGAIPASLGQLHGLEELFLHGNSLSGEIPPSLGNLKNLRKLFLNSNDLVGPVPHELGRLSSLDTLNLSWNNLHGEVPASVRALVRGREGGRERDKERRALQAACEGSCWVVRRCKVFVSHVVLFSQPTWGKHVACEPLQKVG